MAINFYLRGYKNPDYKTLSKEESKTLIKSQKDTPFPVFLRFRKGRKVDFHASMNIKVFPHWWNFEKQRVKDLAEIKDKTTTNKWLSKVDSKFQEFVNECKGNGINPSYKDTKEYFDSLTIDRSEHNKPKPITLLGSIELQIQEAQRNKTVKQPTINSYKVTCNILKQYNETKKKIDFNSINLEFYYDFVEWCNTKDLSKNYIGKHIKTLKTFISWASDPARGYTNNLSYKHKEFKVLKEDVHNIYLDESELRKMWKLDLSNEPQQDRARDLFLIGAYTGLRVSDYNQLTKENVKTIRDVEMISITTQKTETPVAIPLHPIVKAILDKNNGEPPKKMPDQQINYKIKDVAESAGIDSTEHIKKTKGGRDVIKKCCKFELVKTHTARRSFCSNAYLMSMNPIDIMSISGHKTESAFMKYIKLTPEDKAVKMSEHPFFKNATALKKVN
jgi:integrase